MYRGAGLARRAMGKGSGGTPRCDVLLRNGPGSSRSAGAVLVKVMCHGKAVEFRLRPRRFVGHAGGGSILD